GAAAVGPAEAPGWRPCDDSAVCGSTRPESDSSCHAPRSRIAAGRPPCIPHALAWSPGLLSGVPLGNTRCEASAFSPVTLLMRHIGALTECSQYHKTVAPTPPVTRSLPMSTVSTPTTALTLDEINPASFDFWLREDVEGALAKLRKERPVAWHQHPDSGKGFWSITRFDDVAAATRDWETFSSAYGIQVMTDPDDMPYMTAIRSMISTDPPKHTKL